MDKSATAGSKVFCFFFSKKKAFLPCLRVNLKRDWYKPSRQSVKVTRIMPGGPTGKPSDDHALHALAGSATNLVNGKPFKIKLSPAQRTS